jgi:general stress protein YciG
VTITSVNEAGRKGGQTVLRNRGREFYSRIGAKGQQKMRARHPNMASQWGKLGGRPRKLSLSDMGKDKQE